MHYILYTPSVDTDITSSFAARYANTSPLFNLFGQYLQLMAAAASDVPREGPSVVDENTGALLDPMNT